jgi:hypothetical protein
MKKINSHDATGQLTGYLYQVLMALLLLLKNTNDDAQICIEKYDDVAFLEDDEPIVLIQTKHHLKEQSNLSNSSTDLWRTINSWCDSLKESPTGLPTTKFVIITTACVQDDNAALFLSDNSKRDTQQANKILTTIAKTSKSETNKSFYDNFLTMPSDLKDHLIDNMYIYPKSNNIIELKLAIMSHIRYATLPRFEENVYTKLIGWWIIRIIKCLISRDLCFITRQQIQQVLFDIGSEYKDDSLPIDVDFTHNPTDDELNQINSNNRVFINQLNLIKLSRDRIKRCIRDYYNAIRQRGSWVREQLLLVEELSAYEDSLIDEWERLFFIMRDAISVYSNGNNEKYKRNAGVKLYNDIEGLNIKICERVEKPFIMRGTFHDLSNQMKVGWHVDYKERLRQLL